MEQFMNMLVMAMLSVSPNPPAKSMVQVENWPSLMTREHLVATMPAACGDGAGCAVVNFNERTCDVYIAWRDSRKSAVRERALKRCQGYDEPPFRLQAAYIQWLGSQPCKPRRNGDGRAMIAAAVD